MNLVYDQNHVMIRRYILRLCICIFDLTQFANKNHRKNSLWKTIVDVLMKINCLV